MSIIPPGFVEVSIPFQHSLLNRTAYVVYGAVLGEDTDATEVADTHFTRFSNSMLQHIDSNVTVGPLTVRIGQDGGEPVTGIGTLTGVGGSGYPDALNAGQALLLRKNTARGGRRGRGRSFIPWAVADAEVNEIGLIDDDALAPRQASANLWLGGLLSQGVGMVLLHEVGLTVPGDPDPVTGLQVDRLVGSQRRRLARRV